MERRFMMILVGLVLIFGGFLYFSKNSDKNKDTASDQSVSASNHTYGEGKKGVVLIEYGDFQCPACYGYYPILKELKEKY